MERRDHFLAVLSHELRNPVAAITNSLSVARKEKIAPGGLSDAMAIIQHQTRQLGRMLDDLLNVSRVTHNKFKLNLEVVDMKDIMQGVVNAMQHHFDKKNQRFTVEASDGPLFALVDEARMIQAQTNLLINASKYTPVGGHINYSLWQEEDRIKVLIEDDGEGMSAKLLERVFEVFVQSDQQLDRAAGGMGLGLPLVKMIANAHGGSVAVESDGPGKGSKLKLEIPVGNISESQKHRKDTGEAVSLRGLNLLLVEDNDGAREMLARFMGLEGINVNTAANGIEAVDQYNRLRPEMCVVDIGLPDLNGYEVARRIRSTDDTCILVALTGYGQEQDREKVEQAGFDLHVVKPIDPELLIGKLGREFGDRLGLKNSDQLEINPPHFLGKETTADSGNGKR